MKDMSMSQTILARIAALPEKSTAELREMWTELFASAPPMFNKASMVNRLAHRLQELHYGGLPTGVRRELRDMAAGRMEVKKRLASSRPVTGTRLVREYGGKTHTVTVLAEGYEYNGRVYKSLSAIACLIADSRWSGPAFFGLKRASGKAGGGQ